MVGLLSFASAINNNRVTINAPSSFLNLAKGMNFNVDPANASSDGYPLAVPTTGFSANASMPLAYYGQYVWKFSGLGSMQTNGSVIVTSGGTNIVEVGTNAGDASGNITIRSQTNPRVVFSFGWNIQSISQGASNGSGGFLIRVTTKTGFLNNGGGTGVVVNITGANVNTGANGTWTMTQIDGQNFDLQGSTFTNAQASAAGTAIYAAQNINFAMYNGGTFGAGATQMSNLVICKSGNGSPDDEARITGGAINDTLLISQFQYLMNSSGRGNPGWIRFMDAIGVQTNFESDFSQRMPTSYISYSARRYPVGYWTGAISWSAGDNYTCADPSVTVWDGTNSVYFDNAIVQGTIDLNNIGTNPTLAVGGHPAKPILNFTITPLTLKPWGTLPSAAGQNIRFTFQASWLAGLPGVVGTTYTFNYTTVAGDTTSFTGAGGLNANLAAAMNNDATLSAAVIQFSNSGVNTLNSYPGVSMRTPKAGALTVSFVSGPAGLGCTIGRFQPLSLSSNPNGGNNLAFRNTLRTTLAGTIVTGDVLNITFTRSDLSGGARTVAYTTNTTTNGPGGVPDSSIQNLITNLVAQINADATLKAAGIIVDNGSIPVNSFDAVQEPTATTPNNGSNFDSWTGGGLSMSFTKVSGTGTETATFSSSGGLKGTFIFNYLLDGWIFQPGGMIQSVPLESIVEFCNLVGANCWFCWGTHKASFVTAVSNFIAANLNAGLKFGNEPGNELWNFSASGPWGQWSTLGAALNFPSASNNAVYSYGALRLIQYMALAKAAWVAAGRSLSDFYVFQPSAGFDISIGGGFDAAQLKGSSLVTSNSVYANFGALNGTGTATANYNVAGSRPVDITTALGIAPYWNSPWWSVDSTHINGTVAQNAPWLQAALDYRNGLTTQAFTSLVNQFNGTTLRTLGNSDGFVLGSGTGPGTTVYCSSLFTTQENLAAQYDSYRSGAGLTKLGIFHYEAGAQWAMDTGAVSTVNSSDIANLANQITGLGWNVSAYTFSGTNNATECATQVLTLAVAWKHDDSYKNLIKTSYYQLLSTISGVNREVHPAQYGYAVDQWGFFPGPYPQGNQFKSYDAVHEWNA